MLHDLGGFEKQFGDGHAFLSADELYIVGRLRPDLNLRQRHVLVGADHEDQLRLSTKTIRRRLQVVVCSRSVVLSENDVNAASDYLFRIIRA